jgi:hypothetical protein
MGWNSKTDALVVLLSPLIVALVLGVLLPVIANIKAEGLSLFWPIVVVVSVIAAVYMLCRKGGAKK